MTRVLIVDDDPDIASVLSRGLAHDGYRTEVAADVAGARAALEAGGFDAAVVDVMIGDDSGLDLVRDLRAGGHALPVLMLSALTGIADRQAGLKAGADDYVIKPFSMSELSARLAVQIGRAAERARPVAVLDREARVVRAGDRAVDLTEREAALLAFFMAHPGEVLSRGAIFDALWTGDGPAAENVVDVYIGYLRRKLAPAAAFGIEIVTIRSRGFQLRETAGR